MARKKPKQEALVEFALQMTEYPLSALPGYSAWSRKYQDEYPSLIAHLDTSKIAMHPSQFHGPHEEMFEEMLQDLKRETGQGGKKGRKR